MQAARKRSCCSLPGVYVLACSIALWRAEQPVDSIQLLQHYLSISTPAAHTIQSGFVAGAGGGGGGRGAGFREMQHDCQNSVCVVHRQTVQIQLTLNEYLVHMRDECTLIQQEQTAPMPYTAAAVWHPLVQRLQADYGRLTNCSS